MLNFLRHKVANFPPVKKMSQAQKKRVGGRKSRYINGFSVKILRHRWNATRLPVGNVTSMLSSPPKAAT